MAGEAVKQVGNVVRTRRCFRVTLKAKCRFVSALQPLQRAVKQTDVGGAQVGRQCFFIDRKTVVLTGDADTAAIKVFHRMIGAMVTKLHLEGLCATGQRHDLVAQTDAEGGDSGFNQRSHSVNGVVAGLGVARAIAQEDAIGFALEHFSRATLSWHDRDATATLGQHAQNIELDAKVIGDNMKLCSNLLAITGFA
jgi:hypothetical protein